MELTECHLRYLLAIFELSHIKPDVGGAEIAKSLGVKKPTVTVMLGTLMEKGLIVRERFSKVYLTDTGFLLARDFAQKMKVVQGRLPALGFDLSEQEQREAAFLLTSFLREHKTEWFHNNADQ